MFPTSNAHARYKRYYILGVTKKKQRRTTITNKLHDFNNRCVFNFRHFRIVAKRAYYFRHDRPSVCLHEISTVPKGQDFCEIFYWGLPRKSPQKCSLRVKWYQAVRIAEEVETLCERATILRHSILPVFVTRLGWAHEWVGLTPAYTPIARGHWSEYLKELLALVYEDTSTKSHRRPAVPQPCLGTSFTKTDF